MFRINYTVACFLLFVILQSTSAWSANKTKTVRLSGHDEGVLVRDKISELDNKCNFAPNSKLYSKLSENNFDKTLLLVHEPEKSNNTVELLLKNVKAKDSEKEIRLIARSRFTLFIGAGGHEVTTVGDWIEVSVKKINNDSDWEVSFEIADSDIDVYYEINSYIDENENQVFDPDEYTTPVIYSAGKLSILTISESAYAGHEAEMIRWVDFFGVGSSSGKALNKIFTTDGATVPMMVSTSSISIPYLEAEIITDNTTRIDNLKNNWSHGAGTDFENMCDANITVYKHSAGSELNADVLSSNIFDETVKKIIKVVVESYAEPSSVFRNNYENLANEEVCDESLEPVPYCFKSLHNNIVIKFDSFLEKDLAIAIGAATMELTLHVIVKDNPAGGKDFTVLSRIEGEVFDFYDFEMGKRTAGLIDFNSGGAWVQLGYEASRRKGGVFITSVPFVYDTSPFTYHVD